jgi:nitrogen fixation protein NifB
MPVNRRSPNPSSRPVLVAVASKGGGLINQHFGHAKEFLVYEASSQGVRFIGPRKTDLYCSGLDTCGDAETTLEQTIRALQGCEIVLCAKIGYGPWEALENAGIQPNSEHALEPIEEAAMAVYQELMAAGKLDDLTAETGQASA